LFAGNDVMEQAQRNTTLIERHKEIRALAEAINRLVDWQRRRLELKEAQRLAGMLKRRQRRAA
jgi:hypothetical protein